MDLNIQFKPESPKIRLLVSVRDYLYELPLEGITNEEKEPNTSIPGYQLTLFQLGQPVPEPPDIPEIEAIKQDFAAWWERRKMTSSFRDLVFCFMWKKGLEPADIYKAAHMDRRQFSRMLSRNAASHSKTSVLTLCLGMHLNWDESCELLEAAGYSAVDQNIREGIIHFCLKHGIYNMSTVEYLLEEFRQEKL